MNSRPYCFLLFILFVGAFVWCDELPAYAQQPTATIVSLRGEALVFIQGGSPIPGSIDTIVHAGDTIRTHAGAALVLRFSDGTELILGENTNIDLAELTIDPNTAARTSRVRLLWGNVRSLVAPGHQIPGSSFRIETANSFANVQFSAPDSEVLYDPTTSTTTVIPHKFDVLVTNRTTNDTVLIPEGFIGIVHKRGIKKLARTIPFPTGSTHIENVAKLRLHSLAMILREFPEQAIILEGHADNVGTTRKNKKLAQERADAVKEYLIERYDFEPERIETMSYGSEKPVASNDTDSGRARNRRVTISRKL